MKLLIGILLISAYCTVVLCVGSSTEAATATDAVTTDAGTTDAATTDAINATTAFDNTTDLTTELLTTVTEQTMAPPEKVGNWTVYDDNNNKCILAQMAIMLKISYETNENSQDKIEIPLPSNADSSASECAGNTSTSTLMLDFFDGWFVKMVFVLGSSDDDLDDNKYYMNSFTLQYVLDEHFKNPKDANTTMIATRENNDFGTSVGKSYECESNTDLSINDDVDMDISDLHIQPFAQSSGGEFGDSESCTKDVVNNNLIPIIVGCCLAGIIIIVVIGYCIGRYRKKSYTSI